MAFVPFTKEDQPTMANFNAKFLEAILEGKEQALSAGTKIATGSYMGTGKYGPNNKNSLTFDFAPVMVFVYDTEVSIGNANTFVAFIGATVSSGENSNNTRFYTLNKKTLSWYNNKNVTGQLNNSGTTYYYIAIG